jgi:hypothetical protein
MVGWISHRLRLMGWAGVKPVTRGCIKGGGEMK